MNLLFPSILLAAVAAASSFAGADGQPKKSAPTEESKPGEKSISSQAFDVVQALASCHTNETGLKVAREKYPKLKSAAGEAAKKWEAVHGPAKQALEKWMQSTATDEQREALAEVNGRVEKEIRDEIASEEAAQNLITVVAEEANGDMDEQVLRTLLSFHPDFAKNPELEFTRGFVNDYSTAENPKAAGVALTLKIPKSWKPSDSDNSVVAQLWSSQAGRGTDRLILTIKENPGKAGPMAELLILNEAMAKSQLVPKTGKFIRFNVNEAAGVRRGILHFQNEFPIKDGTRKERVIFCYFIVKNHVVGISGLCQLAENTDEALEARMNQMEPLFQAVFDSMKLVDPAPAAKPGKTKKQKE